MEKDPAEKYFRQEGIRNLVEVGGLNIQRAKELHNQFSPLLEIELHALPYEMRVWYTIWKRRVDKDIAEKLVGGRDYTNCNSRNVPLDL